MDELGTLPAYVSLGAGVQSTTLLLLAEHGELPLPKAAIFADTQWEPPAVYEHLAFLERTVKKIPIVRVTAGNLRRNILDAAAGVGTGYASPPLHVVPGGITFRQCTNHFKLRPIVTELRARGHGPKNPSEQWLGISLDEVQRMKPSRIRWQVTRWPLIDLGLTRHDCLSWLSEHGYPRPPKSACVGCPLHANGQWRDIKRDPVLWKDALEVDAAVRTMEGLVGEAYLHYSKKPLEDVDLSTPEDHGQLSLADDECAGACFV